MNPTVAKNPSPCCEHAALEAENAELREQLADVRRSLFATLSRVLDPTQAAPGTSGARLRAVLCDNRPQIMRRNSYHVG